VFLGLALGLCSKRDVQQDSAYGRVNSVKGTKKKQLYELRKLLTNGASILIFVVLFAQVSSPDRAIVATFKSPVSFEQPDTVNNRLEKIEDISRMRFLDPQHFMILARALVELQQVPQATSVLQRGTDWYPRDFALFDYLSNTLEQQGKWSEAAIARQRQVELDPRHARVWSYLAKDLFQAGDEASARRAAQRALENFNVFPQGDQESIKKLLMELGLI